MCLFNCVIIFAKSERNKYKRIIMSCKRNSRDRKESEEEKTCSEMKYLGREIKMPGCHEDTGSSAYLFIPLQKPVFQRAERRRINAPLLRAIALALRKFAANSTPASPVYENE